MSPTCHACGRELQTISSIAGDPHDEPVYTCSCWPIDWPVVALQLGVIGTLIGLFYLLSKILP